MPNQTVQPTPPCVTPPALATLGKPGGAPHGSIADLGVRQKKRALRACGDTSMAYSAFAARRPISL